MPKKIEMIDKLLKTGMLLLLGASIALPAPAASHAEEARVVKIYGKGSGLRGDWIKGIFREGDRLLVSTPAGTDQYVPPDDRFHPYEPEAGFNGNRVTGIAEYGGKVYVATDRALNVREGGKWTALDRFQQVLHNEELLYSDGKSLYALARVMFGGVLRYDGANWSVVTRGPGTGLMNNATSLVTRGEEIFIGTTNNGLYHFNGKKWTVHGPETGLPAVWVTSLAASSEGVWVGTGNGLILFEGGKFRKFTVENGLPSNKMSVLKVLNDKLFIGTMDGGVSVRSRIGFQNVTAREGLSDNRVEAIGTAGDGVWVGTVNGLNLLTIQ